VTECNGQAHIMECLREEPAPADVVMGDRHAHAMTTERGLGSMLSNINPNPRKVGDVRE
jgi:hypothetical protein